MLFYLFYSNKGYIFAIRNNKKTMKNQLVKIVNEIKEAAKKAALAPDKEKLKLFAEKLSNIAIPIFESDTAAKTASDVKVLLNKIVIFIEQRADQM